jgi:acetyltransferase-like isoleucine patch superfamily enzyme
VTVLPSRGQCIGAHLIINRDVLLDGRSGLQIGDNVSISQGVAIFMLEHGPNRPSFANRGAPVNRGDRVIIGARATSFPGVTLGDGAAVAAGAVVPRDLAPITMVVGRQRDLFGSAAVT